MFMANPEMFVDDDLAAEADEIQQAEEKFDPKVPVNIITATGMSITRIAVRPKGTEEEADASLFGGDEDL